MNFKKYLKKLIDTLSKPYKFHLDSFGVIYPLAAVYMDKRSWLHTSFLEDVGYYQNILALL